MRTRTRKAEETPTRRRRINTRRTRNATTEKTASSSQERDLRLKAESLEKIDNELLRLKEERDKVAAEIKEAFTEAYGDTPRPTVTLGSYYVGYETEMGRARTSIKTKDFFNLIKKVEGAKEGEAIFFEVATVSQKDASKYLSGAALDKITETTPAQEKGVKFKLVQAKKPE